jgi:hypothetical protein
MSMFQSRAATDVVFVRYEGCDLRVLDACANDSVPGSLGAYRPVEWTSGSVEKIDISNQGELYAKLPLGVASLSGRVQAGEKFAMEYFVSGVRTATRSSVYRGELEKNPGCKGATHFVYGFALGAFALASSKTMQSDATAGMKDIGAGENLINSSSAEKRGGRIESCQGETAKEVDTCQVPIRLMLRELGEAAPPSRSDRPEITMEETKLRESAARKRIAGDGKGCLADLDAADKQFPNSARMSTRPDGMMNVRAECLLLSGDCDNGRRMLRMAYEHLGMTIEQIDLIVKSQSESLCAKK